MHAFSLFSWNMLKLISWFLWSKDAFTDILPMVCTGWHITHAVQDWYNSWTLAENTWTWSVLLCMQVQHKLLLLLTNQVCHIHIIHSFCSSTVPHSVSKFTTSAWHCNMFHWLIRRFSFIIIIYSIITNQTTVSESNTTLKARETPEL